MQLFKCRNCGQVLYFENIRCEKCGYRLGFVTETMTLAAIAPDGNAWRVLGAEAMGAYRFCVNEAHGACNWLARADTGEQYCLACRHNGLIPDLTLQANTESWWKVETAKHRLFYTLLKLKLPLATRAEHPEGLIFDFPADSPMGNGPQIMTGHDAGRITIALTEADDAEREKRRSAMGEPYRTLLGHFRHEVGHYFWDRLVRDEGRLDAFRAMFGDERRDYGEALQAHYRFGAPPDWGYNYISGYATSHPWEDFAETWAHYLHIVDTEEMATAFGLRVQAAVDSTGALGTTMNFSPYDASDIETIIDAWLPLCFAMNSLTRCLGQADAYPFILPPPVIAKLGFIHQLARAPHGMAMTSAPIWR